MMLPGFGREGNLAWPATGQQWRRARPSFGGHGASILNNHRGNLKTNSAAARPWHYGGLGGTELSQAGSDARRACPGPFELI
jgi:hypothetical protein